MLKNSMAWSCGKNVGHRNSKKDAVWKDIGDKRKRKTKTEMAG
jgi:hypothetical protein